MKCEEVQLVLEDHLDRRPDDAGGEAVQAHLDGCPECAELHRSMVALSDRVATLPRAFEPGRDLWPEIEARITAAKVVRPRFGHRALMAVAATVLLVSSVVTAYLVGRQQASTEVVVAPIAHPVTPDVLSASFAELGVHDYQATRQQLLDVIEGRKKELSPATLEIVLANLRLIDDAMNEIAEALGKDPENELLIKKLVSTYRRQINLLERAAILPSEA
jgi:hypothetical protein